jgi:hypothetical protein
MFSRDLVQQELRILYTMSTNQITLLIPFEELFIIPYILSFAVLNSLFKIPYNLTFVVLNSLFKIPYNLSFAVLNSLLKVSICCNGNK